MSAFAEVGIVMLSVVLFVFFVLFMAWFADRLGL